CNGHDASEPRTLVSGWYPLDSLVAWHPDHSRARLGHTSGLRCPMHFADRLLQACRQKGNAVCVGIDPRWDQLPIALRQRHGAGRLEAMAAAFEEFGLRVLDLVAPLVPVVKPQSAFFEACGPAGMRAQQTILAKARALGLITILDNKRGDIASTAEA